MSLHAKFWAKGAGMKRSVTAPCSAVASLFRGLCGRVARNLDIDPSYVSRVVRGARKSEVVEKAIDREFNKALPPVRRILSRRIWPGFITAWRVSLQRSIGISWYKRGYEHQRRMEGKDRPLGEGPD